MIVCPISKFDKKKIDFINIGRLLHVAWLTMCAQQLLIRPILSNIKTVQFFKKSTDLFDLIVGPAVQAIQ